MELFQAHLGKRERRAPQDPKVSGVTLAGAAVSHTFRPAFVTNAIPSLCFQVTGALLDNEVLLGHLALEGRKETKETRVSSDVGTSEVLGSVEKR